MIDDLELELRLLPGVSFVGFADRRGVLVVELLATEGADHAELRRRAEQLAHSHVDGPVEVELASTGLLAVPGRVQLLVVLPWPEHRHVEIHLAHRGRRAAVQAGDGDCREVAVAVLEALGRLGLQVPFTVAGAGEQPLPAERRGVSVAVVLEPSSDEAARTGLATAPTIEEAAARATLNALNRYLDGSVEP